MPVRTIILDLGRTLVPFSFDPIAAQLNGCREEALALGRAGECGALSPIQMREQMCRVTGVPIDGFETWWNSIFDVRWLIEPDRIRHWLGRYRVGLLSNTNLWHINYLRRQLQLLDAFHFHVLSYEIGAAKPDAAIFAAAELRADCKPDEIFYLDDVSQFVEVARARGWQAEVFREGEDLAPALRRYGLD